MATGFAWRLLTLPPVLDNQMLQLAQDSVGDDISIAPPSFSSASSEHVLLMTGTDGAVLLRGVPPTRAASFQLPSPTWRQIPMHL